MVNLSLLHLYMQGQVLKHMADQEMGWELRQNLTSLPPSWDPKKILVIQEAESEHLAVVQTHSLGAKHLVEYSAKLSMGYQH